MESCSLGFDKICILTHMSLIGRLRDFRAGGFAFE